MKRIRRKEPFGNRYDSTFLRDDRFDQLKARSLDPPFFTSSRPSVGFTNEEDYNPIMQALLDILRMEPSYDYSDEYASQARAKKKKQKRG